MDETAPIPLHLRNAPTKMMKDMKYGEGYLYNPDYRHALRSVISANTGTNFFADTLFIKNTSLPA
jgi:replication-associated recombination protein RarA